MKPNTNNKAILAALLALLTLAVGCGAGAASAPEGDRAEAGTAEPDGASLAGNFAGKVEGTNAFIAVVVDRENHALAYVCDGKGEESAEVAEWFEGAVADGGSLDLRSEGGAHLVAEVTESGTKGTVTFSGQEHSFSASPAEEPAGLYRAEETVDGTEYVGGWILLESGEQRGTVKNRSSGFMGGGIELARPSRPVDGFIGQGVEF
jgi:hypothetical protein